MITVARNPPIARRLIHSDRRLLQNARLQAQPFTPEAGEMWSKEDIDEWIDVLAQVLGEAYSNPELVRTAPHNQAIRRLGATDLDDPALWATTWRAHVRKRRERDLVAGPAGAPT